MNGKSQDNRKIIMYCHFCKEPIYEGESMTYDKEGNPVHYDPSNPLKNCYFPEEEEDGEW